MLHRPLSGALRAAVLVCPPLVEERKSSQRVLVDAARLLAGEAGCAVLRLDYRGCGDSAGDFADFAPEDWIADIRAAAGWLAECLPGVPQVWLGVRAGALLLLNAAAAAAPAGVLLWEPVGGADFVRQLLQRRMVNDMIAYGRAVVRRQALEEQLRAGGAVDLDGFTLTSRQYRQLCAMRFPPFAGEGLVLTTADVNRAAAEIAAGAPRLHRRTLRLPPFWSSVGHVETRPLAEVSAAWLRHVLPELRGDAAAVRAPEDGGAAGAGEEDETPVAIAQGGQVLRGIVHHPRRSAAAAGGVVFLGGWTGDRQGPHRLFVQHARRLAAEGLTCLRIDYRGRGESDGDVAGATIAAMTDDAVAAVEWLRRRLPPEAPLALVAICSGCKVAIAAATRCPGIGRLALWSAEAMGGIRARSTNLRKTLGALRAYGRKLLRAESWRKLLRGEVRADMVGKALVRHETRSPAEARAEDAVLRRFRGYRGRILFVYGGSDPDAPAASAAYERFCRRHGLDCVVATIPHAGHSYYGREWSETLLAITSRWLLEGRGETAAR